MRGKIKFSKVVEKQEIFIQGMIEAGSIQEQIAAYKKAYPTCKTDSGARVNCYKLLQITTILEAIKKGKREKEDALNEFKKKERIRLAQAEIAHEAELDANLSSIALGNHTFKRRIPVFNKMSNKYEVLTVEVGPTGFEMIAAADKLYKRKGSYPRILKVEHGGLGGKPIQYENVATVLVLPSNGREIIF